MAYAQAPVRHAHCNLKLYTKLSEQPSDNLNLVREYLVLLAGYCRDCSTGPAHSHLSPQSKRPVLGFIQIGRGRPINAFFLRKKLKSVKSGLEAARVNDVVIGALGWWCVNAISEGEVVQRSVCCLYFS